MTKMTKHEAEELAKAAQFKQPIVRFPVRFTVKHEESMGVCMNWRVAAAAARGDRKTAPRTTVTTMEEADAFVAAVVAGTATPHVPEPPPAPPAVAVAEFLALAEKNGVTIDRREDWRARNGI